MSTVADRWHLARPPAGAATCPEHGKVPSNDHGKGDRWAVRWRDDEGKQRRRHYAKKAVADREAAKIGSDLLTGTYVDPSDRTTVEEYARRWIAARPHRPTTARRVASSVDTHIAGTPIGSRRLVEVRPSDVQAWATGRAAVLAPSTLRNLVSLLRSIYTSAVLDRLVASSPVVRIQLPRHERARVVPLSVAQVRTLADAVPDRNRAMVLTQAGLGLRIGELLALRVEDVDFLRRIVRVENQIPPGSKERTEPKTPRSKRSIPLPGMVAEALAKHIETYPPLEDGSLFSTRFGATYDHNFYGTEVLKAAVRATPSVPDTTSSHDLRHHYASVLLAAGESVVAVAERLGHDNANLVLSTYGHLMPDSEDRTRKAVDAAWSSALDVPSEVEDAR